MIKTLHNVIDPHLHLFNLQKGDYAWLNSNNPPFWPDKHIINKDFCEADLALPPPNKLAGFVHIEAGFDNQQPWKEIDWLENHCTLPFKSVAFADITASTFTEQINQLIQRKSVVGIRYILDEQAKKILSSGLIHQHFKVLAQAKFSFDAQLSLASDSVTKQLVDLANKHTQVAIIINHAGWAPNRDDDEYRVWKLNLKKLAKCENVAIKLSGWEMSNRDWQASQITHLIQDSIEIFGDTRVMLGSNFPLCLFSLPYSELWSIYTILPNITAQTLEKITHSNAKNWYNFS